MIRVLIERKLKKREHISKLIRQIRIAAMAQPGYISSETLVNTEDNSAITIISTWANVESWNKWKVSKQRIAMGREIEPLLEKPEIIRTYQIISTEEMEYLEDMDWTLDAAVPKPQVLERLGLSDIARDLWNDAGDPSLFR